MSDQLSCYFFKFGLFVTGETEEIHLPKLFKPLMKLGICNFEVIRKVDQRSHITSEKRKLKMVGTGKDIPDRDAQDIGFPARKYLSNSECAFVLLIDDLEYDRRENAVKIFERYRQVFDKILLGQKHRASVHFLVNMLEAYYFGDATAINQVLGTSLSDYQADVETIRHPKNDLKTIYPGFDEKRDGGNILDCLNVEHILSSPSTCASLRALFLWCWSILKNHPGLESEAELLSKKCCFSDGLLSEITKLQCSN